MLKFIEKKITAAQNELIEQHYAEVSGIYTDMRGWRHDYHSHLQTIKGHIALSQMDELNQYLDKLEHDLDKVDRLLKTGNLTADAVLNSKLTLAGQCKIAVDAKAIVPKHPPVSEIDFCVILGNLLDNAIESCMKLPNESDKFLRLYIDVIKGQFYISVANSVGDNPKRQNGEYVTSKRKDRGFGLRRIDAAVRKYGGYVNRQHEPGVFVTEIMIPLSPMNP